MPDIEKKYVYLNNCYYELIESKQLNSGYVSMRNLMTGEYARHRDGILHNEAFQEDELFQLDSSFMMEKHGDQSRFFCTNPGLENFCLCEEEGSVRIVNRENICGNSHVDASCFDLLTQAQTLVRENTI